LKIKGAVLLSRRAFVASHFGPEAWGKILDILQQEYRNVLYGAIVSAAWYPFEIGESLDRTIVDVLGGGDTEIFERIGAASARENLSGAHQRRLLTDSPEAFLKQTEIIYRFYYDTGHRTYVSTGKQSGRITTFEANTYSAVDCLTVIGWHKEALRMCGAKEVQMAETACRALGGSVCQYDIRWTTE
jgi:hypothetical protein